MLRLVSRTSRRPDGLRQRITGIYASLILTNLAAWAWAVLVFRDQSVLLGTALLAYGFGLGHAVDADHIAAIDNVTRKLMPEGKRPVGVGLFFAMGHSSVVILAAAGVAGTATALAGSFDRFKAVGRVVGTGGSALFLFAIAIANLIILSGVWRTYRYVRKGGRWVEADFDLLLNSRGVLARFFRPPALFAAGMSLIDTTDGILMLGAYQWAFIKPIRKLFYNLAITFVSVVVAVLIGGIEILGLMGDQFALKGAFWDSVEALNGNFTALGVAVIGVFIAAWVGSVIVYRYNKLDEIR
jgi:high-affinity nickel-transport protein